MHIRSALLAALVLLAGVGPARAQDAPKKAQAVTMGTKETPPFAMKDETGEWTGISIEIWNRVANELGFTTRYVEVETVPELLDGVDSGRFDLAVAAITVTADRERSHDFSYPYFFTGLGIAVPHHGRPWQSVLRGLLTPAFWKAAGGLVLLILVVGVLIWLVEYRANPEHFGGRPHAGIGSGFWWAAVTMTTVGYGDKAPRTPMGRGLAFIWMFAAIVLISGLTAAITSTLTVSQLGSPVKGPEDLSSVRVAAVEGTSSTQYFQAHGVPYRSVPSLEDALQLLADGDVDCVVHDVPLLRYMIRTEFPGKAIVLPAVFDRQQYAVVMSPHSPYRERINVAILEQIQSDWWDATLQRYLGD